MVCKREVASSPYYSADSVKELGGKLHSILGKHIRWDTARVDPIVQERVGDDIRRGNQKRSGADNI